MLRTVLIIDDCESTATPLEIALTAMHDTRVLLLSNAFDALKILANRDYQVTAVVTDLHLPVMNGFELIDNIRGNRHYATIPIVVVTGDTDPATRTQAFQKGANAYFQKPYSPANLRHELERLIHAS
jgi:CheY-like chemotaxis protein